MLVKGFIFDSVEVEDAEVGEGAAVEVEDVEVLWAVEGETRLVVVEGVVGPGLGEQVDLVDLVDEAGDAVDVLVEGANLEVLALVDDAELEDGLLLEQGHQLLEDELVLGLGDGDVGLDDTALAHFVEFLLHPVGAVDVAAVEVEGAFLGGVLAVVETGLMELHAGQGIFPLQVLVVGLELRVEVDPADLAGCSSG